MQVHWSNQIYIFRSSKSYVVILVFWATTVSQPDLVINANWHRHHVIILGLQPRAKATMLGVNTTEVFLEEFTWK